jgi:abortive infection bacteriophage resistance protein
MVQKVLKILKHYIKLLNKIKSVFNKAEEDFIRHFKDNYINDRNKDFNMLPPFWIVSEIIMFGEIKNIYASLKKNQFSNGNQKNELDRLANSFGAINLSELNRWLIYIKLIRNRCAHHSRVWNTNYFAVPDLIQKKFNRLNIPPSIPNRIYSFLVILNIIIKKLELNINLKDEIENLMIEYLIFDEMKDSAGFPKNWDTDIFWN